MEHPEHGLLEVGVLSDGVRNMIAMVADIAFRMARLNKDILGLAPEMAPGLVLIDEVDMHLHPEWQQMVLQSLIKTFPKAQFIVTTHSPQVISTIHKKHVRVLDGNIFGGKVAAIPSEEPYGRSNADVMQSIMDVTPEPRIPESEGLSRYMSLIEQGDWRCEEAGSLRKDLENKLGDTHPAFIRADMIIRRRKALAG